MDEISNERLEEMLAYTPTYDEDRETRVWYRDLRLALTELRDRRAAGGEAVAWQDINPTEYDPDAPPSHSADNAAMFILDALSKQLGLESYSPADGSETWEGDVLGTMQNILVTAGIWDEYEGKRVHPSNSEVAVKALEAMEELANMPLGISLEDWSRLSSPILAALTSPDTGKSQ